MLSGVQGPWGHLKPTMGDIELLRLFSLADEFK
jgi:hypothetical protein